MRLERLGIQGIRSYQHKSRIFADAKEAVILTEIMGQTSPPLFFEKSKGPLRLQKYHFFVISWLFYTILFSCPTFGLTIQLPVHWPHQSYDYPIRPGKYAWSSRKYAQVLH